MLHCCRTGHQLLTTELVSVVNMTLPLAPRSTPGRATVRVTLELGTNVVAENAWQFAIFPTPRSDPETAGLWGAKCAVAVRGRCRWRNLVLGGCIQWRHQCVDVGKTVICRCTPAKR